MEALLFWYTFIAIYKITRRLISEAGTLNVHRSLSIRAICLSVCPVFNSCRRLPETKRHSSLFIQ